MPGHKLTAWWKRATKKAYKRIRTKRFAKWYMIGSLAVLAATTVVWSLIGAIIQSTNADQFANTFLLSNPKTAQGALLPSQHTFLLKIPLFWIITQFHSTPTAFLIATILLSFITVAGMAYIVSSIEKRPLVLGSIYLLVSAVLLYLPAQSYPGALLPANFAMLTTRNIEYVVLFGSLILLLKAASYKHWRFLTGIGLLALLFASDKLFISLCAGASVLTLVTFLIWKRKAQARIALKVVLAIAIAYVISILLLWLLRLAGVHFDNGATLGPYAFVRSPKDFVIALIYGLLGIATNFGANPAYDAVAVKDIPGHFVSAVVSPYGLGFVVTIAVLVIVIKAGIRVVRAAYTAPRRRTNLSWQGVVPIYGIALSVTAFVAFVASNHYYPADSRYLTVVLIAGVVLLAGYFKGRVNPKRMVLIGFAGAVATVFGLVFQFHLLALHNTSSPQLSTRDATIRTALASHPVTTLVGDYWRVLPIHLDAPNVTVTPLESCTKSRNVLSSTAWQPDLKNHSFAYLLRLDGTSADFPRCTLTQVTDYYGRPNSSVVVDGTRTDPKELLLFYDAGMNTLKAKSDRNLATDTVTPIPLEALPATNCESTTLMQFVAHEDDDLLFMNPDLTTSLRNGNCVRTVYYTAGDAGSDRLYWLGRQHGAEAAYNQLLGTPGAAWAERIVLLDESHTITVANPADNQNVSLIFLHLPDGNTDGSGFANENFESLVKLYRRTIPVLHTVDDEAAYTYGDLTSSIVRLLNTYSPNEIRTQSTYAGGTIQDHSDHTTVGEFTTLAFGVYKNTHPDATLAYYVGYPIHELEPNVTGEAYDQKVAAFLAFGQFDPAACSTLEQCNDNSVYGIYLQRQYTSPF